MKTFAPAKWMETMGVGVRVAVIDSGIAPSEFLIVRSHRSFLPSPDISDATGHGTKVASIIGSRNPLDLGKAPHCLLFSYKIAHMTAVGHGPIVASLEWAVKNRPDVVNMSFAFKHADDRIVRLIRDLDHHGTICIAAHSSHLRFPHSLPSVVSVGGEGSDSCHVRTAARHNDFEGTSAAAAKVSGVAACAKAFDRKINRQTFLEGLKQA